MSLPTTSNYKYNLVKLNDLTTYLVINIIINLIIMLIVVLVVLQFTVNLEVS